MCVVLWALDNKAAGLEDLVIQTSGALRPHCRDTLTCEFARISGT